jgi:hypothetical protein
VLATLSSTHSSTLLAHGDSAASALTSGYHLAFTIGAVLATVAVGLAVFGLRSVSPVADVQAVPDERELSVAEFEYAEEAA